MREFLTLVSCDSDPFNRKTKSTADRMNAKIVGFANKIRILKVLKTKGNENVIARHVNESVETSLIPRLENRIKYLISNYDISKAIGLLNSNTGCKKCRATIFEHVVMNETEQDNLWKCEHTNADE